MGHDVAHRPTKGRVGRLIVNPRAWAVLAVLIGFGICLRPILFPDRPTQLLRQAADAIERGQFAEAEQAARAVLEESPDCAAALVLAGEAAAKSGRTEEAKSCFLRVPAECPVEYVRARHGMAQRMLVEGRACAAEKHLRLALDVNPLDVQVNMKLAVLLQTEGRTWEALPHVRVVVRSGQCGRDELLMTGAIDSMMIDDPSLIDKCIQAVPEDPVVLLGRGRLALLRKDDAAQAEMIFRRIVEWNPDQIEAQARLGEVLVEKSDPSEFLRWNAAVPKSAEAHPRTWFVRGLWAKRNGQPQAAIRCFVEALRLHPNHASSNFQLSQVLISLGMSEAAEPFVEKSRLLSKQEYMLSQLRDLNDPVLMRELAEVNEQMGCDWEALGWNHTALLLYPDSDWARQKLARFKRFADPSEEFTAISLQPALVFDLSTYPLPTWPEIQRSVAAAQSRGAVDGDIRFVDVAAQSGLMFRYFNGTTPTSGPDHIIQANGSGVGILDFDGDGWPDVYFAQGGLWEQRGDQNPHKDRLFQNLGNGNFADVTALARVDEGEYCQGVTVGDYNDDGLPDIYVANIGKNRLYENMGDGTFRDVTDEAGVGGDGTWSTSCAIVDLNGDGFPEIYVVHYVSLKEALARDCGKSGHAMGCAPTLFHADQDRLFLNLGDGKFRDVTDECGIKTPDGKGLGIVATDFDGSGKINVFVGNDTTPNLYFVNQTEGPGKPLKFVERGLEYGVAINENGQSMASMGIAARDCNGDGLLDLFIGTFYHDSNTLFLQNPDHTFVDESRRSNLREPTFNMLTFGAQFLDGDLDGWPDLIQANGHVDRSYDPNVPDRMPPQYFKNLGGGKFVEFTSRSLGPYFEQQCLGRTVAVLDLDRDGKEDACIAHLDVPAALLANRTKNAGHYLAVQFCGRASNRDAVGAVAELTAGGRTWTRPVVAGDGYMSANEKKMIFGLDKATRVDRLQVRWPSGLKQTFQDLAADQELLILEGSPAPLPIPK